MHDFIYCYLDVKYTFIVCNRKVIRRFLFNQHFDTKKFILKQSREQIPFSCPSLQRNKVDRFLFSFLNFIFTRGLFLASTVVLVQAIALGFFK